MRLLCFTLLVLTLSCNNSVPEPCEFEGDLHREASYPIGVAVQASSMVFDQSYREFSVKHFNSFTAGNAMKMDRLQPVQGEFDFSEADSIVAIASRNNIRVHGHTLIWHNQNPAWLRTFEGDREAWLNLMRNHIQTVMSHFEGKVMSWDVVNEAFDENGSLRDSPWRSGVGDDYVLRAFEIAHEADPDAILFYNDFNLWRKASKCKAALDLVEELQGQSIPVHGIGFQGHIDTRGPGKSRISNAIQAFVDLGLVVHISELDVSINPATREGLDLTSRFNQQADVYEMVVSTYQELVPEAQRFGITIWGLNDNDSWIPSFFGRTDAPLLWDGNYIAKPALCSFAGQLN